MNTAMPAKMELEEIEGSHRTDADEVEQSALDAEVGERLMHALEKISICALFRTVTFGIRLVSIC